MKLTCPDCEIVVAVEDRRKRVGERLAARNGAIVELPVNQAPRVKCPCGRVVILMKMERVET